MPRLLASVLVGLGVSLSPVAGAEVAAAPAVECLRIGEGVVSGRLVSIQADTVTLSRNGAEEALALSGFREIALGKGTAPALPPPFAVWADKGTCLMVRQIEPAERTEALDLIGYGWEGRNVPLGSVRAVASRALLMGPEQAREEFRRTRENPPPSEDRLMLAADERSQVISCIVESVTEAGLTVAIGRARRTVPWSALRWAVLSPGGRPRQHATGHMVELADGTTIRLQSLELRGEALTGEESAASYRVQLPSANGPARIRIWSDAYHYLSDLAPETVKLQPFLDVVWQPRFDRAVTGDPLVLAGKPYLKGLGMDVRTEMTFALDGAYSRFHALVGVDDSAGALGRVVFKVLADGRLLYQSSPLSGGDALQTVSLDISGVRRLSLVADFGGLAWTGGNFADWAEARVVR